MADQSVAEYASGYGEAQAKKGLTEPLPPLETFPNQYGNVYHIEITIPEYSSVCPKTGMPDYGTVIIHYIPDKLCLELKALKYYIYGFRNLGIFYENLVNRILKDVVSAVHPRYAKVEVQMTPRGGISSRLHAEFVSNQFGQEDSFDD